MGESSPNYLYHSYLHHCHWWSSHFATPITTIVTDEALRLPLLSSPLSLMKPSRCHSYHHHCHWWCPPFATPITTIVTNEAFSLPIHSPLMKPALCHSYHHHCHWWSPPFATSITTIINDKSLPFPLLSPPLSLIKPSLYQTYRQWRFATILADAAHPFSPLLFNNFGESALIWTYPHWWSPSFTPTIASNKH